MNLLNIIWIFMCHLAAFKCVTARLFEQCNHVVDLKAGQKIFINSPYYPQQYPIGTSCRYTVKAPLDHQLDFKCTINLKSSTSTTHCQNEVFYFNREGSEFLTGSEYFCGSGTFERRSFLNLAVISYISTPPFKRHAATHVNGLPKNTFKSENNASSTTTKATTNIANNYGIDVTEVGTSAKPESSINNALSYVTALLSNFQMNITLPMIASKRRTTTTTPYHQHQQQHHHQQQQQHHTHHQQYQHRHTESTTTRAPSLGVLVDVLPIITWRNSTATFATAPATTFASATVSSSTPFSSVSSNPFSSTSTSPFSSSTAATTFESTSKSSEATKFAGKRIPKIIVGQSNDGFAGIGFGGAAFSGIGGGGTFSCLVEVIEPQCDCGWSTTSLKVAGASGVAGINEYPSMAGVLTVHYGKIFCGAAIIHHRYLLSAAHCFFTPETNRSELIRVVVGEHDVSTVLESLYTRTYEIDAIIPHEHFRTSSINVRNDIALLRTRISMEWNRSVGPACLPFRSVTGTDGGRKPPVPGQRVETAGWGTTSFGGEQSSLLLKTTLDVITTEQCRQAVHALAPATFCSFTPGRDTCQYDSGGALYLRDQRLFAVGIVSYGFACATHQPSVNTKVASFLRWIKSKTPKVKYCVK